MVARIVDKYGNAIQEGDYVFTRIRGGSHEGKVRKTQRLYLDSNGQ
jgi:hypothetical protein